MLLTDAVFSTINSQMNAGWTIERQEINAADGATGAPGDITIYKDGAIFKAIEVTERPIDGSRVDSTFSTKITLRWNEQKRILRRDTISISLLSQI